MHELESVEARAEQAERDNETLSEANRALQRSAIANRDGRKQAERERDEERAARHADLFAEESSMRADLDAADARLASVPALVEALRGIYTARYESPEGLEGAKAYEFAEWMSERAGAALTVYEQSHGGRDE